MDSLPPFVVRSLTSVFICLLIGDFVDNLVLGDRYQIPTPLFGLVGSIIAGLLAPEAIRRWRGNGKGKGVGE